MEINIDNYNVDAIRDVLEDYYGTAMITASPFAMVDLIDLSNKSDYEILCMAINMGINIEVFNKEKNYWISFV